MIKQAIFKKDTKGKTINFQLNLFVLSFKSYIKKSIFCESKTLGFVITLVEWSLSWIQHSSSHLKFLRITNRIEVLCTVISCWVSFSWLKHCLENPGERTNQK